MVTTLKSESEVTTFLDENAGGTVISKGGYYTGILASVEALFKRVLLATNQDHLVLDTPINFGTGDFFYEVEVNNRANNDRQSPLSGGASFPNSRIRFVNSGRCSVRFEDNTQVNFYIVGSLPINTRYILRIERVGLVLNMYADGVLKDSQATTTSNLVINQIGMDEIPLYSDMDVFNINVNGEYFGLNEPSGATFTGSLGTTGLCITSNASPTYIDDVMIQPIV